MRSNVANRLNVTAETKHFVLKYAQLVVEGWCVYSPSSRPKKYGKIEVFLRNSDITQKVWNGTAWGYGGGDVVLWLEKLGDDGR